MAVFAILPVSVGDEFAAEWFDSADCLWRDERLRSIAPLAREWNRPQLQLYRREHPPTPVLFNPHAFAVSSVVRKALSTFSEFEFLPVQIADHGEYFIAHIVVGYALPVGSVVHRPSPPSNGNVVRVDALPASFQPEAAFFRILQPTDSPAGRLGRAVIAEYATDRGAEALSSVVGGYLELRAVPYA